MQRAEDSKAKMNVLWKASLLRNLLECICVARHVDAALGTVHELGALAERLEVARHALGGGDLHAVLGERVVGVQLHTAEACDAVAKEAGVYKRARATGST